MQRFPWEGKHKTLDDIFLPIIEAKRAVYCMGGSMPSIYTLGAMEAIHEMGFLDGPTAPDTFCATSGSAGHVIFSTLLRDFQTPKEIWKEVVASDMLNLSRGRRPGRPPLDIDFLCREIFAKHITVLDEHAFARAQAKLYVGVTDIESLEFGYLPITSPEHVIPGLHATMALPGLCGIIDTIGTRKIVDGFIDPLPFDHFKNSEDMDYLIMILPAAKDQGKDLRAVERMYLAVCQALGRGVNEAVYAALINRNKRFHDKYQKLLAFQQQHGRTLIIQPEHALPADATCKDPKKVEASRMQGYRDAYAQREQLEYVCARKAA